MQSTEHFSQPHTEEGLAKMREQRQLDDLKVRMRVNVLSSKISSFEVIYLLLVFLILTFLYLFEPLEYIKIC